MFYYGFVSLVFFLLFKFLYSCFVNTFFFCYRWFAVYLTVKIGCRGLEILSPIVASPKRIEWICLFICLYMATGLCIKRIINVFGIEFVSVFFNGRTAMKLKKTTFVSFLLPLRFLDSFWICFIDRFLFPILLGDRDYKKYKRRNQTISIFSIAEQKCVRIQLKVVRNETNAFTQG